MMPTAVSAKPHFAILDGLRGVAAIMVVVYHLGEALVLGEPLKKLINHGHLAVDFFFLLSGFVIGYAYDSRWTTMTTGAFFKVRLVRLQPMVALGMLFGAALFYTQVSVMWPNIPQVPVWSLILVFAVGSILIPMPPALDIRGWGSMYPLNGASWSLFYEYVANIFYALWIKHWSLRALGTWVAFFGLLVFLISVIGPIGGMNGGWTLEPWHVLLGVTRVMFSFFGGLLMSRTVTLIKVRHAFIWCSLLLVGLLAMPRVGIPDQLWQNGLYEAACILVAFPLLVYVGASGAVLGKQTAAVCNFLGALSYPLYVIHFPLIFCFIAWGANNKVSMAQSWPMGLAVFVTSLLLAYASLKLYDEPVRKWLRAKYLTK